MRLLNHRTLAIFVFTTRNLYKFLFIGMICAFTVISLMPVQQNVAQSVNDKFAHFLSFFVFMFLYYHSWPGSLKTGVILLAGYGMLIEIMQSFTEYRMFSMADWLADATGIAACLAILYWRA